MPRLDWCRMNFSYITFTCSTSRREIKGFISRRAGAFTAVLVAAERTGRLPHATADALAARLKQTLAGVSYRAPNLAQLTEDRWLTVGDDPDLVGAYA